MYTAYNGACKPETAINAWRRMGLEFQAMPAQMDNFHRLEATADVTPGRNIVVINRKAISDAQLGGSELRGDEIATKQVVRMKDGDKFVNHTFDFSTAGRAAMDPSQQAFFRPRRHTCCPRRDSRCTSPPPATRKS